MIFAFGVIATLFAAYQAYKAWGVGWAIATGLGLLVVCLVPYVGSLIALGVGVYIYNEASMKMVDDSVTYDSETADWGAKGGSSQTPHSQTETPDRDPMDQIDRLKQLHDKGAISDEEFERKKAELLEKV